VVGVGWAAIEGAVNAGSKKALRGMMGRRHMVDLLSASSTR